MKIYFLLLSLCLSLFAAAQHDHDHAHDHGEAAATEPAAAAWTSLSAVSDKYELVLKYKEIVLKDSVTMRLFISDFQSNRPLAIDKLKVKCPELSDAAIPTTMKDTGIYEFKTLFNKEGHYFLKVNLGGLNEFSLGEIHVHAEDASAADEHAHEHHWYSSIPFVLCMGFLLGILVMLLFRKAKKTNAMLLLGIFILSPHASQTPLYAGDGHNHDAPVATGKTHDTGTVFEIPKETQFLFNILTMPTTAGDYIPANQLFGNIVPASGGSASVQATQNGIIRSLLVRQGQAVQAGQTLAILEQTLNMGENVGMASQVGSVAVELAKAQKTLDLASAELKRLEPIRDIISGKEWQLAQSNYESAKVTLANLQELAEKELPKAKAGTVIIKSPIAGVVSAALTTAGSYVNMGQGLFVVENAEKVFVEVQVTEQEVAEMKATNQFEVTPLGESTKKLSAKYLTTMPSVNRFNQTQRVLLELDNSEQAFKLGEFVRVFVYKQASGDNKLLLPYSALGALEGLSVAFVKIAPEQFEMRFVNADDRNASWVAIQKGIQKNERVVVSGTYQVKMIYLSR